jgi:SAM-dependent methyltransferase
MFVSDADVYRRILEQITPRAEEEIGFVAEQLDYREVPPGSRVLDLACGVGRHAIELARAGYHVVGADVSPTFVERARELAEEAGVADATEFVVADMREIADELSDESFDAIVNLFTSFGYYDDETSGRILEQCLRLVRPDGVFVLDTVNRDALMRDFQQHGVEDHGEMMTVEDRGFDIERGVVETHWTILEQTSPSTWETALEVDLAHRVYTLNELIGLFEGAGWSYMEAFGTLTGGEMSFDAPRLVGLFKAP